MIVFIYIFAKLYSLYRYLELCVQLHTFYKFQENGSEENEIRGLTAGTVDGGDLDTEIVYHAARAWGGRVFLDGDICR